MADGPSGSMLLVVKLKQLKDGTRVMERGKAS